MKKAIFFLVTTVLALAAIYFTFGGPALAVTIVFLVAIALAVVCLTIGSVWSARLMERGAKIALAAQVSDDRRDGALIRAITDSGKNWIKVHDRAVEEARNEYPALPFYSEPEPGGDFAAAGFTIEGFEKEQ